MAKISKNAKKLLALTLAGVMTVGTAVPGTAMSTVQEAQAADEVSFASAQEALNYLKEAFENKYPTTVFVFEDEKYDPNISEDLKEAADNVREAGYSVNFVPVVDGTIKKGTTVTVSKDNDTVTQQFDLPVEVYTAERIANQFLGATSDKKIDLSDIEITEETSKATVKKLVEEKVAAELDGFARKDDVKADVTVNEPVTDNDVKEFAVTVKLTAGTSTYEVTGTVSTEVAHVATDSEKAAEIVKNSSLVAVVPDSVSIGASSTVTAEINQAVCDAAKAAVKADEQFADLSDADITIKEKGNANSMIGYGEWHGVLQITVGTAAMVEVELDATVVHESDAEAKTVINLELVEAKDEIEVGTGFEKAVTGMKIYFEDGTSKELASSKFATVENTYFTYNKNAFSSTKLGTTSVEFKSLNSVNPVTVTYTANVVSTKEYDEVEKMTEVVTESEISSLTSSDENVITIVTDEDKEEWSFKAVGAGKATVTVVAKDGRTYTSEVTVEEDGKITFAAAKYLKTESYITSDSYGLIADKVTSQSQTPDNWKDDVVAKAEVVDLNGTNAVKITPVANGEATFKVTGGDNGKLENTITVTVKDAGIEVKADQENFDELVLNQKTQDALLSRAYSESDLNGKDEITLNVEDFDFPSEAKLVLKNDSKEIDTVSADEITGIKLEKDSSGKLNLVVEYCGVSEKIEDVAAIVNAQSVENTVAELGLVADSIKSVETPDHNEYIQAELTKNASGQSIVYITPGEDLTATTDATVKVVVEDAEGNTAEITVAIEDGKITNATPKEFSGYTDYTVDATAAGKIVYTLGDAVSYDGIYLVSKDGKDKVAVTEKMVTGYTTSTTTTETGALAEEKAYVQYGGLTDGKFTYYVKPAVATVDVDSLGLADGEKVTNVTWKGDSTISASLTDDKTAIEIMATKTEQSGSVLVTTNKGNTVNVKVSVDANGDIETSTNNYFESSMTVVDNTVENLGVVGTSATSSNTDVAIVKLAGNRVVITSVGVGTAEITVTDGNSSAIIPVTVDEFGTITIGDIQTAVEDGFVRGEGSDWYYYINGKKVTNDWVAVEEADPYNNNEVGTVWYHFDKDGKMQRGWIKDESGWKIYNLDSNGRMRHDMWINAEANEELGMPTGIYHLLSDGAAQMNGWAESITEGIYWFCAPNSGVFDASNPANWATSMPN